MRLVSFPGGYGRVEDDHVVPMGASLLEHLAGAAPDDREPVPLDQIELLAPVPCPGKIVCVGLNYRDHAVESGQPIPEHPILFAKFANSVIGPGATVEVASGVGDVDYEAELGVVIGRVATGVAVEDALQHVAGYVALNDVSSRELQFRTGQWLLGKAIDTFLPMGPWMVTADEVPDPQALGIRCSVNGELRQSSTTAEMIFPVADLIASISATCSLAPGDVIATGTPPGVGMGFDPPRYLADGDSVVVEIDGLGRLENRISVAI